MPIITCSIIAGRPAEQRRALIREVTDAVARTLGSPPEQIRVLIKEVPAHHWAVGGEPRGEFP